MSVQRVTPQRGEMLMVCALLFVLCRSYGSNRWTDFDGPAVWLLQNAFLQQLHSLGVRTTISQFYVGNSKNHFVMTIVMWIRVHKATHFENRKSILHFIAFMVWHKDSHHNCYRLTKFVTSTGDPTSMIIAHFTILFVLIVLGKVVQIPGATLFLPVTPRNSNLQ